MANIKLGIPTIATVQKVGNKSKEEGIAFASKVDDMSFASEFISTLVKNTFKFDVFSQFDSIDSLDMNPMFVPYYLITTEPILLLLLFHIR